MVYKNFAKRIAVRPNKALVEKAPLRKKYLPVFRTTSTINIRKIGMSLSKSTKTL